ncbi:MAG: hypothetical protein GF370_03735 [Candidatus Nealsonbacteria bacterium]|nr:hypothetical protein [Candidatus Nealsonbacteria bacterium]
MSSSEDKVEHKIFSYFILRRLAEKFSVRTAKRLTRTLMTSKELLDKLGLGDPEKEDLEANEKGIREAIKDINNKAPYRYNVESKKVVERLLQYLRLKRPKK